MDFFRDVVRDNWPLNAKKSALLICPWIYPISITIRYKQELILQSTWASILKAQFLEYKSCAILVLKFSLPCVV